METLLEALLGNTLVAVPLAAAAWGASRSKARPALAHALWLLVLLKLLTPPLFRLPVLQAAPAPEETAPTRALAESGAEPDLSWFPVPAPAPPADAPCSAPAPARVPPTLLVFFAWTSGAAAALALALVRTLRFRRMIRDAAPAPSPLPEMVHTLGRRLGLKTLPDVHLVQGRLPPLLWAPGRRARILLPEGLRLSPPQWRTLVAHELAHLKRRDHLVRWLEVAVRAVYWWSPLAWWASRGLHDAEERCCDAWVVWALPRRSGDYAHALLETLEFLSADPPVLSAASSGAGRVPSLARRLTMILNGTPERSLTRSTRFLALTTGLVLLPFLPVLAQEPKEKASRRHFEVERFVEENQERPEVIKKKIEELAARREALARAGDIARAEETAATIHQLAGWLQKSQNRARSHGSDMNPEIVVRALKRGIHALKEAGQEEEAQVLGELAERIARDARAHHDRPEAWKGRADVEELTHALEEVEHGLAEAREKGREDEAENLERKAEELRAAIHEHRARARTDYVRYGDAAQRGDPRIGELAERLNHLSAIVEKLVQRIEKQESRSPKGGGAR